MHTFDILSFHPGKQHNLEQAKQINRYFKNYKHVTSLFFTPSLVKKVGKFFPGIARLLEKRSAVLNDRHVVSTYLVPEIKMLFKRSFGKKLGYNDFISRNRSFQNWLLKKNLPPKICIGYDGSSWKVFEEWKNRSFLILDLTVAVPEYKLLLAKKHCLSQEMTDKHTAGDEIMYEIYRKELDLADLILCGSQFVIDSCTAMGVPNEKLYMLPYGVELDRFSCVGGNSDVNGPLKFAFIGNVIYRKGADVLLRVWKKIMQKFSNVELHFYGNIQMQVESGIPGVFFHGFIDQDRLIEELKTSHISVLPSFFEGSSYAIYQSMALGLAMITTPNAGSIIIDKKNGLLTAYGNEEELFGSMSRLICDKPFRKMIVENALHDIQNFTWNHYGRKLAYILYDKIYTHQNEKSPKVSPQVKANPIYQQV